MHRSSFQIPSCSTFSEEEERRLKNKKATEASSLLGIKDLRGLFKKLGVRGFEFGV
jgi:hypothetical protein